MAEIAIRVENLGKKYRIGSRQESYKTLRDSLTDTALRPLRAVRSWAGRNGSSRAEPAEIWALKDVSFEVKRGEVVGIIGRNGAGKSTLLKILSRITEPTEGYAEIHGRVGSLLEVGTGFHPELTGRENIYLNGAILGMKKAEIERKFDEMVSFAGVEKFIDTPVKHYSTGMYLRLAFAVAAHLDPEILLVDEVLAVGDAAFQKKCLGKMRQVANEGRTVFFVSHNITVIRKLCTSGLYLNSGALLRAGSIAPVCNLYLHSLVESGVLRHNGISLQVTVLNKGGAPLEEWPVGEEIRVHLTIDTEADLIRPAIDLALYSPDTVKIFAVQSDRFPSKHWPVSCRHLITEFRIVNTGLTIPEVYLDVGVRPQATRGYIGLFQQVEVIPVSPVGLQAHSRSDGLLCLPTQVLVIDAK
ncbi:MAG: ABC transporter ATP-binding protein [Acidobacteria bacterium]|nr:ABC transporter ATP-binding protein [Acidobacteriota bacterium]